MAFSVLAAASKAEEEWVSIFDGETLKGWTNSNGGEVKEGGWLAKDGVLYRKAKGGDLYTAKEYADFEFRWEWKISSKGNSGVKYRVTKYGSTNLGPEYQVLDDENHPDGAKGANRQTAAFYDVLEPAKDKPIKQPGKFNSSRILVKGNTVKHFLNGKNVLTYKLGSDEVKAAIAKSKFKNLKVFGQRLAGHILLQDHGDAVWYRNIRIRDLSKN